MRDLGNKNSVAILAVDPGVTTGCAAGLFDLRQQTVAAAMRRSLSKGHLISWEVGGDHVSQSWEIASWFRDWHFKNHVELEYVRHGNFYVAIENFIPRQQHFDVASLLIIGGLETLLVPKAEQTGFSLRRVEPVARWGDDKWLRSHGLWVSSNHERDARRHLASAVDALLA
jgi:hypothetical protein